MSYPPLHDTELERAVLSAALQTSNAALLVATQLEAEAFVSGKHIAIHKVIRNFVREGKVVDVLTIGSRLAEVARNQTIIQELLELADARPPADITAAITRLKDLQRRRRLRQIGTVLALRSVDLSLNTDEICDRAEQQLYESWASVRDLRATPIDQVLYRAVEELQEVFQHRTHTNRIPTGIAPLDALFYGWPKKLAAIHCQPGLDPAAVLAPLALNFQSEGQTLVATDPLSKEELTTRLLCAAAEIRWPNVANLQVQDWARLTQVATELNARPLSLFDTSPVLENFRKTGREGLASTAFLFFLLGKRPNRDELERLRWYASLRPTVAIFPAPQKQRHRVGNAALELWAEAAGMHRVRFSILSDTLGARGSALVDLGQA